jgi:hypothetical protein
MDPKLKQKFSSKIMNDELKQIFEEKVRLVTEPMLKLSFLERVLNENEYNDMYIVIYRSNTFYDFNELHFLFEQEKQKLLYHLETTQILNHIFCGDLTDYIFSYLKN